MSLDEDLGDATDLLGPSPRAGRELHVSQAGDAAALDADKVRVLLSAGAVRVDNFESPDVIPSSVREISSASVRSARLRKTVALSKPSGTSFSATSACVRGESAPRNSWRTAIRAGVARIPDVRSNSRISWTSFGLGRRVFAAMQTPLVDSGQVSLPSWISPVYELFHTGSTCACQLQIRMQIRNALPASDTSPAGSSNPLPRWTATVSLASVWTDPYPKIRADQ